MSYEDALSIVLANEATCRYMLKKLIDRGVKMNIDHTKLSHDDCVEIVLHILSEIKRIEKPTLAVDEVKE